MPPAPHKMNEKKYHQVSPTLQYSDYQIFMCDTCLKKSLTKYHQVSPTFLAVIPYRFAAIYSFHTRSLVSMLLRFILQVSNFRLHPDVQTLYTPMYTVCRPGCTIAVHPGIHEYSLP